MRYVCGVFWLTIVWFGNIIWKIISASFESFIESHSRTWIVWATLLCKRTANQKWTFIGLTPYYRLYNFYRPYNLKIGEPLLKTFIVSKWKIQILLYVMARNMCAIPIRFISAFFIYLPHLDTNIYPFTTTVHPVQSQYLTRCLGSGPGILESSIFYGV